MTDIFETAAVRAAGVGADHPLAAVLAERGDIMTMTQQAHDAALTPNTPGGLSHAVRAALACRMSRVLGEDALAAHFTALMEQSEASAETVQIADPSHGGGADKRLCAIIRHADLTTSDTKSVAGGDIAALIAAGISEDDVVRLSELIAFVNYQARVTAGLRLLEAAT